MGPTSTYREYSASKASVLRGRVQIIGSEQRVFEVKRIKATNSNTYRENKAESRSRTRTRIRTRFEVTARSLHM
jgi:hypothetical protein